MNNQDYALHAAEREKQAAAASSVWAATILSILKLAVGLLIGSLGMLAEAAHSALDLAAALITFLAVRVSARPPDAHHHYGHGKVENLSALAEALLLFVTCIWIIYEALQRLFIYSPDIAANLWAFLVMLLSIAVNINRSRLLYATARKYHSQALEADALHFSTDVWSSLVVLGGLALAWLGQNLWPGYAPLLNKADAAAALIVAALVISASYDLGKRTVDALIDRAPDGLPQQIVQAVNKVEGVLAISQIRVRRAGPHTFVDMSLALDRNLPFERTHAITQAVEEQIRRIAHSADVVIHAEPQETADEKLVTRIRTVASQNNLAVHNIAIHQSEKGTCVDLHLEVDDRLSLQQAHDLASQVEQALQADMPNIIQINTHIESRPDAQNAGRDVTVQEQALVKRIKELTEEIAGKQACHAITIRRAGNALSISLHCDLDGRLSIAQVHDIVTRIEHRLQESIPNLERVLIHAEPLPGEQDLQ